MNPITWCVVLVETDREEPIVKPARFDDRRYLRSTTLTEADHKLLAYPHGQNVCYGEASRTYTSRRLVDRSIVRKADGDIVLLNWPTQNYPLDVLPQHVAAALEANEPDASRKNIVEMTRGQRQIIFDDAKLHALGYLYHLQTTVHDRLPADQKSLSLRRFALSQEFGTPDHLPPKPYLRAGLRMKAMYMMREQDTLKTHRELDQYARIMYPDGVGCWQFEYDFHPTGRGFMQGPDGPWEAYNKPGRGWGPYSDRALLPLRSLIPIRIDGLLAAQKNFGASDIVLAAVRLHDQSMMIGQAAGAAAAVSLRTGVQPRELPGNSQYLSEVRRVLCSRAGGAVPLALWPFRDVSPEDRAYEAVHQLAALGGLPLARNEIDFQPAAAASESWRQAVAERSLCMKSDKTPPQTPGGEMTRGQFAIQWWRLVQDLPERPVPARKGDKDADGDGIADGDDPLPFDAAADSWPDRQVLPQR